jgi:hypothetical protein
MNYYRQVKIQGEDVEEESLVDTDVSIEAGIPGYDEDARIQYAGGLRKARRKNSPSNRWVVDRSKGRELKPHAFPLQDQRLSCSCLYS